MTPLLRQVPLAGRGVVAAVPLPLLRPRRPVVRVLVPLGVARRRLVRKPAAAVPRRRLGRLRRAGPVALPVRVLARVALEVPVVLVLAAPAEARPPALRLWLPRVVEYQPQDPVGRAGHLRLPALAPALHARARTR